MFDEVDTYIDDWFINIDINKIPFSYYIIRRSLLESVRGLKPLLYGSVLDLGCGVMPYKKFLMNESIKCYIGLDLEPTEYHNMVKPDLYWNGRDIPLEDSSCDFVIATEFLEHYYDTNWILREINRVLKSGGRLFFTVPAIWPIHEAPYDYYRFTPYSLIEELKKAKFCKWELKSMGGYHYSLALFIGIWNDNKLSSSHRMILRPFLKRIIKFLISKDTKHDFENGKLYSGISGIAVK